MYDFTKNLAIFGTTTIQKVVVVEDTMRNSYGNLMNLTFSKKCMTVETESGQIKGITES